jgi:hypothetical protein
MNETPRPSAAEIRRMLETELSSRARIGYTLLLLVDLAVGSAIVSLLATEPALPPRTQIAFGVMTMIAVAWAVFFIWTLTRRKLLLVSHQVVSARLAVAFAAVYTAGALVVGITQDDVRSAGFFAAAIGVAMLLAALALLVRATNRVAALLARKQKLDSGVRSENAT